MNLDAARKELRALSRAIGMTERYIRQALQAWSDIPESTRTPLANRSAVMRDISGDVQGQCLKTLPIRSERYLAEVRRLPCANCSATGRSDAAHPNTGKGAGTKADDTRAFPLCRDDLVNHMPGCHGIFDQHAMFTKEDRRAKEIEWGRATFNTIKSAGQLPAGTEEPKWG